MEKTVSHSNDYIIFPINLLESVFSDTESCFYDLLISGVIKKAKHIDVEDGTAIGLCAYDYFEKKNVPKSMISFIKKTRMERWEIFDSSGEACYKGLSEDWKNSATGNTDEVLEYGKIKRALYSLKIQPELDIIYIQKRYAKLEMSNSKILVMIKHQMISTHLTETKSEYDLATFCVYVAIKSILGQNKAVKTNKQMIITRAFGSNQEIAAKYSTRRRFDKIMRDLEMAWGVSRHSDHNRGFYISTNLPVKELALIAYERRQKTKIKKHLEEKAKAQKEALQLIKIASTISNPAKGNSHIN